VVIFLPFYPSAHSFPFGFVLFAYQRKAATYGEMIGSYPFNQNSPKVFLNLQPDAYKFKAAITF
jgi:hypothetical protein